jgi:hypothetical protein
MLRNACLAALTFVTLVNDRRGVQNLLKELGVIGGGFFNLVHSPAPAGDVGDRGWVAVVTELGGAGCCPGAAFS